MSLKSTPATPAAVPTPTPLDWSQFSDSVYIKIERPPGNKMGNTVCSGVIIHPHAILTTAHCADQATKMTVIFDVEKGSFSTQKEELTGKQIHIHPEYHRERSFYKNDLAILFLSKPAPLEEKLIRKIPTTSSLKPNERLVRIGIGIRNGINARNFTDPIFVKIKEKGVLETSDVQSHFGDSGGPLYSVKHDLLALHSTLEDFDGKSTPHVYSVYLPHHKRWIESELKKSSKFYR